MLDSSLKSLVALLLVWTCFWPLGWWCSWPIWWTGLGLAFLLVTGLIVARVFFREDDECREPTEQGRVHAA